MKSGQQYPASFPIHIVRFTGSSQHASKQIVVFGLSQVFVVVEVIVERVSVVEEVVSEVEEVEEVEEVVSVEPPDPPSEEDVEDISPPSISPPFPSEDESTTTYPPQLVVNTANITVIKPILFILSFICL